MTVRERVIAIRLISKIEAQGSYGEKIGISYKVKTAKHKAENSNSDNNTEKN